MSLPEDFQFSKEFEIGSFQVNPDGRLKLASLADLLQEIAWRHADSADFGRNLVESRLMWALSRMDIRVERFPKWGETVSIFTGGKGADKLFAFREFMVWDQEGKVLVRAMSSWLLLNMETKRIQRPEQVLSPQLFNPHLKPAWQPAKLSVSGEQLATEEVAVRYADLDLYSHVNNTSYIRWVENFLADKGIFPSNIIINYLAECVEGDYIVLSLFQSGEERCVEGRVADKVVFLAKVS
jgi:medium-chain acyl-[acyl-carrier-protein] hydrolase